MHEDVAEEESGTVDETVVHAMMDACTAGDLALVQTIVRDRGDLYARRQLDATGASPLMAAAAAGHIAVCRYLLQEGGAPWNAVDRFGQCAGNYATDREHWTVVNLLVDWATRAELILGRLERQRRDQCPTPTTTTRTTTVNNNSNASRTNSGIPVEHEPSTKPDYLRQRLQYTADGQSLLDADEDAVMMEWERPLMQAHASILMEAVAMGLPLPQPHDAPLVQSSLNSSHKKRVLNVGFGMGIIDAALQELSPAHHIIIEAHPDVYQRMLETGWDTKASSVRLCYGTWQTVMPQLIAEGVVVDAIFYDTVRFRHLVSNIFRTIILRCYRDAHTSRRCHSP